MLNHSMLLIFYENDAPIKKDSFLVVIQDRFLELSTIIGITQHIL